MAKKVGSAFIEVFLKGDKAGRDMRKLRRSLTRVSGVVAGVTTAFAAMGAAAGAAAAVGIFKSVKLASDLAEAASKLNVVFGEQAGVITKWSDSTAKAMGRTRTEVYGAVAGFQDLFVPMGIGADEATVMSQRLTVLAADLASFNNLRTEDVIRDLQSAMTGSSETVKKYGVVLTGVGKGMDTVSKTMEFYNKIVSDTSAAHGDVERTSESYANAIKFLKAETTGLMEDIGDRFKPGFETIANLGVEAMEGLRESLGDVDGEFELAHDALMEFARNGQWDKVGELIGLQIRKGIRSMIGEGYYDFAEGLLDTSTRLGRAGIGLATDAAMGFHGSERGQGFQDYTEARTRLFDAQIAELIAETKNQTKVIENQEAAVMQ